MDRDEVAAAFSHMGRAFIVTKRGLVIEMNIATVDGKIIFTVCTEVPIMDTNAVVTAGLR